MDNTSLPSTASGRRAIWQRPVSRRTLLAAGAATAATAGVATIWKGGELSAVLSRVHELTHQYDGILSSPRVRVAHLLRRAGFAGTSAEIDRYSAMGTEAAAKSLIDFSSTSNASLTASLPRLDPATMTAGGATVARLQAWWLQRMVQTARPLEEKMTLFWHGLLTSGLDKAGPGQLYVQNQLFRSMALGNFDDLLKAVSKDPAMMVYLDTETNRKGKPNENYARELMELFTTGIGHYTEDDVRESARAFTGWTLQGAKQRRYTTGSLFVPRLHDADLKTFMGRSGNFTGDDIVEMIVPLRATAERLSARLFSFFAYPNPEKDLVQHLADVFQAKRYNVGAVVTEIFSLDSFYSTKAYRSLIKSPAELVASVLKAAGASSSAYLAAATATGPMGQALFYPPNVAGWPAGTSWINSSTLLNRINFAGAATDRARATIISRSVDELLGSLLDGNVTSGTRQELHAFASAHPDDHAGLLFMVLATPEFQLS
jgi:uncharacterized protein (DUF1800 family)